VKNTTAAETIVSPQHRNLYETDHSNIAEEDAASLIVGGEQNPPGVNSSKKRRRRFKKINQISITPTRETVLQSLVVEAAIT